MQAVKPVTTSPSIMAELMRATVRRSKKCNRGSEWNRESMWTMAVAVAPVLALPLTGDRAFERMTRFKLR